MVATFSPEFKISSIFFKKLSELLKEEEGRAFAQVKTVDIKHLPFAEPSDEINISISYLVDQIIEAQKSETKITDFENKIDQLVYKLYDLTEEEIKIIENA